MQAPLTTISTALPNHNMEAYLSVPPLGYAAPTTAINNMGYLGLSSQLPLANTTPYFNGFYPNSLPLYCLPPSSYYTSVPLQANNFSWGAVTSTAYPMPLTLASSQSMPQTAISTQGDLVVSSSANGGIPFPENHTTNISDVRSVFGGSVTNGMTPWTQSQILDTYQTNGMLPSHSNLHNLPFGGLQVKDLLLGTENGCPTSMTLCGSASNNDNAITQSITKPSSTGNNSGISTSTASTNSASVQRQKMSYSNNILYKTILCNDYKTSQGKYCPRGESCQFAHGLDDLHVPTGHQLYHTKMCSDLQVFGKCSRGSQCYHAHHPSELRSKLKQPITNSCTFAKSNKHFNDTTIST